MKNKEHFLDDILEISLNTNNALCNIYNELIDRDSTYGCDCNCDCCEDRVRDWLNAEYVKPSVDWSKVLVDTKVFARNETSKRWEPRYFAEAQGNRLYCWTAGATSWSANGQVTLYSELELAD